MTKSAIVYNERAWAIDVVSQINRWTSERSRIIKSAGGEWSLPSSGTKTTLFPDILLFGDMERASVLQGWELKMPDTRITDKELLNNAKLKATRMGWNSFVIWNASEAVLYQMDGASCSPKNSWQCENIRIREDVRQNTFQWCQCLSTMLEDICDFLENTKSIRYQPLPVQLNEVVSSILGQAHGSVSDRLKAEYKRSRLFRLHVDSWWADAQALLRDKKQASAGSRRFGLLASEIILHWVHRFLFAHYLKRFASEASDVDQLKATTSITEAEGFFEELSRKRDYAQVFKPREGSHLLSDNAWRDLLAFNNFLKAIRLSEINQRVLQESLQNVIRSSQRKLAGQYCTPMQLAHLLATLTMDDLEAPMLDPCCGTGTIARAMLNIKTASGIEPRQAVNTTLASDLHSMPLQFATVALALGETPFQTIKVFQQDALKFETDKVIQFVDANTGAKYQERLPEISCIVTNPPFVRFENWGSASSIQKLNELVESQTGFTIDRKSDYFVPIVFAISNLLQPGGRLGVIFPNAWLGTRWAETFRKQLRVLYAIEMVVTSGCGRWFPNADIVTTLVIMRKRDHHCLERETDKIVFATTHEPIRTWKPNIANTLLNPAKRTSQPHISRTSLTIAQLNELEQYGFCWTAFFTDLSWWDNVKAFLVPAKKYFTLARGERRGWDALFYPPSNSGIESVYLKPVLKTAATVQSLQTAPKDLAFCCSATLEKLKQNKHTGALAWIQGFELAVNTTGVPLPECLKRSGYQWYEMRTDTLADLAVSINPGKRLFFIKLTKRSFVNQRLTCLIAEKDTDIDLCHALLCSLMGCLYLEAMGFGRGLGVLDLSATRLRNKMWILDPSFITSEQRERILNTFSILKKRDILDFEDETKQQDRLVFEDTVLSAFGLNHLLPKIKEAVLNLHQIRNTVMDQ